MAYDLILEGNAPRWHDLGHPACGYNFATGPRPDGLRTRSDPGVRRLSRAMLPTEDALLPFARRWDGAPFLAWEGCIGNCGRNPIDPKPPAMDALLDICGDSLRRSTDLRFQRPAAEQENKRLRRPREWSFGGASATRSLRGKPARTARAA